MDDKNGVYTKVFRKHKEAGKFSTSTLEQWKNALRRVSLIKGIIGEGEQEEMVEKITECVAEYIEMENVKAKHLEGLLKIPGVLED
ncbi:hypothetical protein SUGI_0626890 [Cryptomeria japonica]|nr:hypothetical protein SUGI_0626890 [Cryptomeria japonica]